MSFNQYTWDLYKQTTIGIEMIKYFSDAGGYVLFKDYCPYANFIPEDLYNVGWRIYIATVYQIMTIPAYWKKQKIYTFHLSH